MKYITSFLIIATALSSVASAKVTIHFKNDCPYTVWPAVGKAPYGSPDPSVAFGAVLAPRETTNFEFANTEVGIRAWGRTGCDSDGSNCATGHCNGGLICTDAGINAGVIVSEYGYADFGAEWGGKRTSWDLSHVGLDINLDTSLKSSDGQSVKCTASSCPNTQAYSYSTDYAADRNSPLGHTYTHTFCA